MPPTDTSPSTPADSSSTRGIRSCAKTDAWIIISSMSFRDRASFILPTSDIAYPPGNFVLYFPHQMQRYDFADDAPCETFRLHFSGYAVPDILNELELAAGVYTCAPGEKIISAFRHLIQEDQLRQPKSETEKTPFSSPCSPRSPGIQIITPSQPTLKRSSSRCTATMQNRLRRKPTRGSAL